MPITKPSPANRVKSSSSIRTETLTWPGALADHDQVVDRGALRVLVAHDQRRQLAREPVARLDAVERHRELLRGHRGERAEAPAGGAEHGAAGLRAGADGRERGPVPAERDDQVAARRVARLGDLALLALGGHLDELGTVRIAPRGQRVERVADLAPRVDDEPDAADWA